MATMMVLSTVLSGINVMLILALLYVYAKNLAKIRSMFTAGLFLFGMLFLMHNAAYLYFMLTMMPYYASGLETYAFTFTLLQTIAFAILNWITWR